jgi:CubicO group peptidase (beta-lactamase class C family)
MFLDLGVYDGKRILSEASARAATSPQSPPGRVESSPSDAGTRYGFGWMVGKDGSFAHGGSDGTYAWVDPARRLIGVVFTQSPGGDAPRAAFRLRVTEACLE